MRERNFLWLLASRLFLLMPLVGLLDFENFFLQRSLGLSDHDAALWNSAAGAAIGVSYVLVSYPAARLYDRFGPHRPQQPGTPGAASVQPGRN
jgi:hypothetical protein